MWSKKIALGMVVSLVLGRHALAQLSPCQNLTGTWISENGDGPGGFPEITWTLTHNVSTNQVTGTMIGGQCGMQWPVTGTMNPNTGQFTITGAGFGCQDTFVRIVGTLNPGATAPGFCAGAPVTTTNDFGSYSDRFYKNDKPAGEATSSTGDWGNTYGPPVLPYNTIHVFRGTASGVTGNHRYGGRAFREGNYATGYDNCWFPGSTVPYQGDLPNQTYLNSQGQVARQLSNNQSLIDQVGWTEASVAYYRQAALDSQTTFPCERVAFQAMYMSDAFGNDVLPHYKENELHMWIEFSVTTPPDTTNWVSRDGLWMQKDWPRLGKPSGLQVDWNQVTQRFEVFWNNNSPDATSFEVWRKTGQDGEWVYVSTPQVSQICSAGNCFFSTPPIWEGTFITPLSFRAG